MNFR
jgi:hypothetical protein